MGCCPLFTFGKVIAKGLLASLFQSFQPHLMVSTPHQQIEVSNREMQLKAQHDYGAQYLLILIKLNQIRYIRWKIV